MQVWRSRMLIVAVIILLPLEVALLVGLWPYLPIVGRAIAGTVVVACVCASVTMISWTWRRAIRAFTLNYYGAGVGLAVMGIALGVVDWAAVDVQSLMQTLGV